MKSKPHWEECNDFWHEKRDETYQRFQLPIIPAGDRTPILHAQPETGHLQFWGHAATFDIGSMDSRSGRMPVMTRGADALQFFKRYYENERQVGFVQMNRKPFSLHVELVAVFRVLGSEDPFPEPDANPSGVDDDLTWDVLQFQSDAAELDLRGGDEGEGENVDQNL